MLWEGVRDNPEQRKTRAEVVETVAEILQQVEMWKSSERAPQALLTSGVDRF